MLFKPCPGATQSLVRILLRNQQIKVQRSLSGFDADIVDMSDGHDVLKRDANLNKTAKFKAAPEDKPDTIRQKNKRLN